MVKPKGGAEKSQNWLTFLHNHTHVSWGMDFFTVPTIRFQILYVFVVLNHARRQVVHVAVTAHPTMPWGDPAAARGNALWHPADIPIP
jgi:hypothetical protein